MNIFYAPDLSKEPLAGFSVHQKVPHTLAHNRVLLSPRSTSPIKKIGMCIIAVGLIDSTTLRGVEEVFT